MKTEKEIRDEIKLIKSDERYGYAPALVQVNAPLALIQVAMKNRVLMLEWVLDEPKKKGRKS